MRNLSTLWGVEPSTKLSKLLASRTDTTLRFNARNLKYSTSSACKNKRQIEKITVALVHIILLLPIVLVSNQHWSIFFKFFFRSYHTQLTPRAFRYYCWTREAKAAPRGSKSKKKVERAWNDRFVIKSSFWLFFIKNYRSWYTQEFCARYCMIWIENYALRPAHLVLVRLQIEETQRIHRFRYYSYIFSRRFEKIRRFRRHLLISRSWWA